MSEVIQKKKSFIPPVPLPKESPKSFTPPRMPSKPVAQQPSTESVALKPYSSEKRDLIQKKILENPQAGKFRPSAVDAIQRKCALCEREDAIQRKEDGEMTGKSPFEIAASGFSGTPIRLPHLGRIQKSFGRDMSHVEAFIGGRARMASRQLGATAYTSGNRIAFADNPSLELAAHEAAHVVQQQSGKVQLKGGVGEVGDEYERHADKVADLVVQGKSAASLLGEYTGKSSFPENFGQTQIQRRGLTDQEQNIMNRLEKFAFLAKDENHVSYSGSQFAANVKAAKANLLNDIGAVPRGTDDPERLMTTLWSLHIWATDPTRYAKAKALPNFGENIRPLDSGTYKCNRFVGDAYAIGAGIGYGGRGYPTRGNPFKIPYPVSANELASDDPDVNRFPVTKKPLIGDVISFELGGLNDHTGINLGNEVYISARNSKERPVWDMQPQDGVQITPIKSNSTHNYRRYSPPGSRRD